MDLRRKVTELVVKKLGNIIDADLKERIYDEKVTFDVNAYTDELFEKYFTGSEIENVENEILGNRCRDDECDSDNSTELENNSQESLELDGHEFLTFSTNEIVENLQSESRALRTKCLREMEICAEDLINQTSWNAVKKILLNFLEGETNRETYLLTLKIFQKVLLSPNKPQMVCEAFAGLAEVISFRIDVANVRRENSYEEIYDLKENKWLQHKKVSSKMESEDEEGKDNMNFEVLLKSMLLLLNCQNQMPGKWIRFHDKRLREIVFSFIHLLSSTTNSEKERISGLELISILNPTGKWCRNWCHTATGRSLLCSALRKYKTFFVHIVEIILTNTRKIKSNRLLPVIDDFRRQASPKNERFALEGKSNKENHHQHHHHQRVDVDRSESVWSTPFSKNSRIDKAKWPALIDVPKKVAAEAVFCHSLSLMIVLIQFRSGRALFPVQTTQRKRLLSVQDLVSSMTDYFRHFEREDGDLKVGIKVTSDYRRHMSDMMNMLENVQTIIYSARSSDRMSRMLSR